MDSFISTYNNLNNQNTFSKKSESDTLKEQIQSKNPQHKILTESEFGKRMSGEKTSEELKKLYTDFLKLEVKTVSSKVLNNSNTSQHELDSSQQKHL